MTSPRIVTGPYAIVDKDEDEPQYEDQRAILRNELYVYKHVVHAPLASVVLDTLEHFGPRAFRILILHPGEGQSRLECTFKICDLDDERIPAFSAISYTWKESKFDRLYVSGKRVQAADELHEVRHPIWCDGKRLLISTNLRDCLRRMREKNNNDRVLWVDALCINQRNMDERATQVGLMHDIYSRAYQDILWLGEEDEYTAQAFKMIEKLWAWDVFYCQREGPRGSLPSFLDFIDGSGPKKLGLDDWAEWEAWIRLLERPVFNRMWIVQEVAASPWVWIQCGSHLLSFEWLVSSVDFIVTCGWLLSLEQKFNIRTHARSLQLMATTIARYKLSDAPTLDPIITRGFEATDPRDKIFALLGLFRHAKNPNLCGLMRADYRKPVTQVYIEASLSFIAGAGSLDILSQRIDDPEKSTLSNLPSWVPDYSSTNTDAGQQLPRTPYSRNRSGRGPYNADGSTAMRAVSYPLINNLLPVHAIQLSTVKIIERERGFGVEQLIEWEALCETLGGSYTTGESTEEALWRTLIANYDASTHQYPASAEMGENFNGLSRYLHDTSGSNREDDFKRWSIFARVYAQTGGSKLLFVTESGVLGICPRAAKKGDSVWVVAGARAPLIVRQHDDSPDHTLIGECYVHGIMHGEAVLRSGSAWTEMNLR